ncbi:MAG: molybdate ABC transporter substrate-binding protein [Lachnospiraceae bacterium]|nr:molybdate ABC transporter substrate-binding protein [Lachnospiraceae bacterium]
MKKLIMMMLMTSILVQTTGCTVYTQNDASKGEEDSEGKTELTIFAAASLTDVAEELEKIYEEKNPGTELVFSFGSSGALRTQIEEGAPCDVFISAAQDHMDALEEEGMTEEGCRSDLLENKVVLVVPKDSQYKLSDFEGLKDEKISLIGIGEPESVPAGKYAVEVLTNLGLYEDIKDKFNYGTDVRAVLAWIEEGEVDCGIVYATDAYSTDKAEIAAFAPEGSCDKVIYPVAVMKENSDVEASKAFVGFLKSDEAMELFEACGFSRVE